MSARSTDQDIHSLLVHSELEPRVEVDPGHPVLLPVPSDKMGLQQLFRRHPAAHFLIQLRSPASRRTQAAQLRRLARYLGASDWHEVDWPQLGYGGCNALLSRLAADEPSAAAYNAARSALRGVMRQAFLLQQIDHEAWLRIQEIPGEAQSRRQSPAGRFLTSAEVKKIFENCDDNSIPGIRDAAIIGTLFYAGLRRSEAAALELNDIRLGEAVDVRRGKGRKFRRIPMIKQLTARLEAWHLLRGISPGPYFRRISRKGRVLESGISSQTVYNILKGRAGTISCSPHDARRTFVSRLLAASHDLSAARRLAGHESTETTARYDRREELADLEAMEQLSSLECD